MYYSSMLSRELGNQFHLPLGSAAEATIRMAHISGFILPVIFFLSLHQRFGCFSVPILLTTFLVHEFLLFHPFFQEEGGFSLEAMLFNGSGFFAVFFAINVTAWVFSVLSYKTKRDT